VQGQQALLQPVQQQQQQQQQQPHIQFQQQQQNQQLHAVSQQLIAQHLRNSVDCCLYVKPC
jgi:hypothetical protein